MSKESEFFIYLLERYAASKGMLAPDVLRKWDELGLTDFIYGLYDLYHVERLQNAFDDIDELMAEQQSVKL